MLRVSIALIGMFSLLLNGQLRGEQCDTPGHMTCEEITGILGSDCSVMDCLTPINLDDDGNVVYGAPECPKTNGQYTAFEASISGGVYVRVSGGAGSGFTDWSAGQAVICTNDFVCDSCELVENDETPPCKSASPGINRVFYDSVGVPGTECCND